MTTAPVEDMPLTELGDDVLRVVCEFLNVKALGRFEQCCQLARRFTVSAWDGLRKKDDNERNSNDAPRLIVERQHRLSTFAMRMKQEAVQHYGTYYHQHVRNVDCPGGCNFPPFLDVVTTIAFPEEHRFCIQLSCEDVIHETYFLSFDVFDSAEVFSPAFIGPPQQDVRLGDHGHIVSARLPIQSELLKTSLFEGTEGDSLLGTLQFVVVAARKADDPQGLQPSLVFPGGLDSGGYFTDDGFYVHEITSVPVDTHLRTTRLGEVCGYLEVKPEEKWVRLILQHSTPKVF